MDVLELGVRHVVVLGEIGLATLQCSFTFDKSYKTHNKGKATLKE
jgi:hypothetical protein